MSQAAGTPALGSLRTWAHAVRPTVAGRRIAVLTTGRQDWGVLRSVVNAFRAEPGFECLLIAGGTHTSPVFGRTLDLMRAEGFDPDAVVEAPEVGTTSTHAQAGRALEGIGDALAALRPEALVLVGDRYETAAAALAATVMRIPIVHLHGGETTLGAFDDTLRHAITQLSQLHLVSHPKHAERVRSMGMDGDAVWVVGAPGLDNMHRTDLPDAATLERQLGIELASPVVIVTVHPATVGTDPMADAEAVIGAMDAVEATYIITLPNADPGALEIRSALLAAAASPGRTAVEALGDTAFWGLMRVADVMLGNSSSALIEAPAVGLPAVNVGIRQAGRTRSSNVIDVAPSVYAVAEGLRTALSPVFRSEVRRAPCPFGDGRSASRVVEAVAGWKPPFSPRFEEPEVVRSL